MAEQIIRGEIMDANSILRDYRTHLLYLVEGGHECYVSVDGLKDIIENSPDIFRKALPGGVRALYTDPCHSFLHACAGSGKSEIFVLHFILEHGGRELINTPDVFGRTPLYLAKAFGKKESVDALLAAGADPALLKGSNDMHFMCIRAQSSNNSEVRLNAFAELSRHPELFLVRDQDGRMPLDYLLEHLGSLKRRTDPHSFSKKLENDQILGFIRTYIRAGLLFREGEHPWVPEVNVLNEFINKGLIESLFDRDLWKGREKGALALAGALTNKYGSDVIPKTIDLTPMERIVAAKEETAKDNAGRLESYLTRSSDKGRQ